VRAELAAPAGELVVYVRDGCPHCADAKAFLERLHAERPGLRIRYRAVDRDPTARDELVALSRAAGVWPPGVPTFVIDGEVRIGFDDDARTGRELRALVERIDGSPSQARGEVDHALFGTLSAARLGLPLFTLAVGLLDGFNPCAMWVLLFLLSLLVRLNDRPRMALVAGTFVLVSGAVYFAFMAAWLNVFLAVGLSDLVRIALGGVALLIGALNVKDFVAIGAGPSLSIPASARPALVARMHRIRTARALPAMLLGAAALAVVVNFVELLCTAGLPAIYTAVLAQRALSPAAHYAYLALYIASYMADDILMVTVAVAALGAGKLTERSGRVLKLASGIVMLALGLVLLLMPQWLA
jgi:glutaredoxin